MKIVKFEISKEFYVYVNKHSYNKNIVDKFGPEFIWYDDILYYKGCRLHRENKVAYYSGSDMIYMWFKDGKKHRIGGCAVYNCGDEEYWIEGKKYKKKEYEKASSYYKKSYILKDL